MLENFRIINIIQIDIKVIIKSYCKLLDFKEDASKIADKLILFFNSITQNFFANFSKKLDFSLDNN